MQQELDVRRVPNFVLMGFFLDVYLQMLVPAPPVIEVDGFPSDMYFQATYLPLKQGLPLL